MRKILILAEVALVLLLFFYLRGVFKSSGFSAWQTPLFGRAILSSCLLFFVLPLASLLVKPRNLSAFGLTTANRPRHRQLALRTIAVVMPVTVLFPVIAMLGTDHQHWLGASILALGFGAAGAFVLRSTRHTEPIDEAPLSVGGFSSYVGILLVGVGLCYVLQPISELITRLIVVVIFVAFLEEFFFRGYVQSRLNDVFGRPYSFFNVNYGAGLISAAVIFGLFHPLTVADATPWAWALWTAMGGLLFGFLREKTDAIVTPALVHGAILVPNVFFGGT